MEGVDFFGGRADSQKFGQESPTDGAGTLDPDIGIDLQMLANTEGYHTLEQNLRRMNFVRSKNSKKQKLSWRWETRINNATVLVELLADTPEIAGGKAKSLPTDGRISALSIPHLSVVFDQYNVAKIQAELLGSAGIAIEEV